MTRLRREILPSSGRLSNSVPVRVMGGVRRPVTSTLASVALVLGALGGAIVVAPPAMAACSSASFAGGTGTSSDPFLVDSQAALIATDGCGGNSLGNFLQTQDITLTGTWTPLNNYEAYVMMYDGGGYSISGLNVNASSGHAGLWARWQWGGSVSNLTLVSPQVTSTDGGSVGTAFFVGAVNLGVTMSNVHVTGGTLTSSSGNIGGLVGYLNTTNFTISDSSVDATITSNSSANSTSVGGLVGNQTSNSLIQTSSSTGSITVSAGVTNSSAGIGGLVGYSAGRVHNSFSTVAVTANNADGVGGLIGGSLCNSEFVLDSYSTGAVSGKSGSSTVGGLVGRRINTGCQTGSDSFWDKDTSGKTTSEVGTGKSTAEMKTASTYSGWDTSIWRIADLSYPVFTSGAVSVPSGTDFGTVPYGGTSSRTITVTNTGDGTLTVNSAVLSGTDSADFTVGSLSGCSSVSAGATCSLTVNFTASSSGSFTASLEIATSAGAGTVALSGTVSPPGPATATWTPVSTPTAGPFQYTLTFSESITGLTASDFTNQGTASGCVFSTNATIGTTFTIDITSCRSGTLEAQITAGSVTTVAGSVASPVGLGAPLNTVADSFSVGTSSSSMAISRDGTKLYVFSPADSQINVYSTTTNAIVTTIPITLPGTSTTESFLVASPTANKIYAATDKSNNGVYVIDTDNDIEDTAARVFPTGGGTNWNSLTVSPDGQYLYITTGNNGNFRAYKIATANTPMTSQVTGNNFPGSGTGGVRGTVVSADGSVLYYQCPSACGSYVYTQLASAFTTSWPSSFSNITYPYRVKLGFNGGVLSPDGATLYLQSGGSIQSFDATQPIDSTSPAGSSSTLSVSSSSSDGSRMVITSDGSTGYLPYSSGVNVVDLANWTLASPSSLTNPGKSNARVAVLGGDESALYVLDNASAASVSVFALASLQADSISVVSTSPQTVTWAPTTSITTSTTAPSVLASTDGDGAISYAVTSAGSTGCTVDSSTAALTFTGAGSCAITATAAQTATYDEDSETVTFTVALTDQPITVSAVASTLAVYSTTTLSTSGVVGTGQVTYGVASGGSNCSISGSTLTALGAGTCTVTSSVAADSIYAAATSSAITVTVQLATQTLTWAPSNTSLSFSDSPVTPSVGASSDGDGVITYSVTSAGSTGCTVNSNTGTLTYSAPGTCVVRATAASSTAYDSGTKDVTFTIAAENPTAPTITSASAGDATATVAFTVPSSNGGATITGYTATASPGGATGTCSSSPCTITGLSNGTAYTIQVTATNSAGTSVASLVSPSVSPATSTGAVENLSVAPGNGQLEVSWNAPACLSDSSCGTLTGYEVFTSTNNGSSWTQFGTSATAINKTVTGLVNGTQYDVKVTVTTSTSSADALAQQVPATTPSAPTGVTVARLTATTASVGWAAPSSDGGQAVTSYTVTATSSDGGATVTATPTSSPVTLTLDTGKTYTVTVRATNLMGSGSVSSASASVTMGLAAQSITLVPSALTMAADSTILLSTSGSTGTGAKTFAVSSGPCTVSGAALAATATGTCVVTATIAADVLNAAATSSGVSVTVTPAVQTVTWSPTTVFTVVQAPTTLTSAASNGDGSVVYSVTSAGTANCSFSSGSTLVFTAAGTCTVQAIAGSSATYAQSAPIALTITVTAATRTVTWSPTTTLTASDSGSAASSLATLSAGTGTIAYSVSTAAATGCTVNALSAVISFTAPGTCVLAATAPADASYSVTSTFVTFTISSAPQTVSWSPTTALTLSQSPVTVASATSSGDGSITYAVTSQGTSDCQITSTTGILVFSTEGQCLVTATAGARTGFTAGSTSVTFLLSNDPNVVPDPVPSSSGSGSSSGPATPDTSVDTGAAVSVPGNSSLFIGSGPVAMTVSANSANTGLDMSMGQWEVSIAPAVAATALPLGPQGELRTTQGQTLDISGSSYLRGTTVNIYIMSTPILIGAADVSARGNFTTTVTIPPSMRLGTHTLQIVGVNPGNETSRASLGMTVVSAEADASVVTSPIGTQVGFKKNTAKLTKRSATSVNSLVGQIPTGSTSLRVRVLMFIPKSASRFEVKLNKKRQKAAVSALRTAGYVGAITTKTVKKKSKKSAKANAITIWFSTPDQTPLS